MNIKCPKCSNMTIYGPENPFRPFCSKRCQIVDTAAWAEGEYSIPSPNPNSDLDVWDD